MTPLIYHAGPPKSDDGWSVTTPRDPEDDLHSQPGEAKTGLSWDPRLFAHESTPSPSPPVENPVSTRQGTTSIPLVPRT